jgi:hypothetical protein
MQQKKFVNANLQVKFKTVLHPLAKFACAKQAYLAIML